MSAVPNLRSAFLDLEKRLEAEPETVTGEIVRGVYAMTPRPRARHGGVQGNLFAALRSRLSSGEGSAPPDWLFVIEPELRSLRNFTRVVPDVAGWKRSGAGWPELDVRPIPHMPDWVAEVLSPSTAAFDREEKAGAYGAMGVGWLWLVDADARRVETFENVRGQMVPRAVFEAGAPVAGEPFAGVSIPPAELFL